MVVDRKQEFGKKPPSMIDECELNWQAPSRLAGDDVGENTYTTRRVSLVHIFNVTNKALVNN